MTELTTTEVHAEQCAGQGTQTPLDKTKPGRQTWPSSVQITAVFLFKFGPQV